MLDLEWQEVSGGFENGPYRVEPVPGPTRYNWQLIVSAASDASGATRRTLMPSHHRTLRGAYAQARHLEQDRIRRVNVVRHAAAGALSLLMSTALYAQFPSFPTFLVTLTLMAVGLRSLATAAVLALGDPWGWTAGGPPAGRWTRTERLIASWAQRLHPPRPREVTPEPSVRVLPPLPPD